MNKWYTILLALLLVLSGCAVQEPAPPEQPHSFSYQGTVITLNTDAAPVLTALGEAKHVTQQPSCASDGIDKTYDYGSFFLTTCPLEGKEIIYTFWFIDDSVTTAEGIHIGSTQEAALKAYGETAFDGKAFTILQGGSRLIILITNGAVSSIQYSLMD